MISRWSSVCTVVLAGWFLWGFPCQAKPPYTLAEDVPVGKFFNINAQVELKGNLTLPPSKENPKPGNITISGKSGIRYSERILARDRTGHVERTIRDYEALSLERTIDNQEQVAGLRAAVSRLVILRHQQMEVPFSPDGPLIWEEIDLVRTDVFTPALRGLLPTGAVNVGQTWTAQESAVKELTDFARINEGKLTCKLERIIPNKDRVYAMIRFSGTVGGLSDDGLGKHTLNGALYFDMVSKHISYITMKGQQTLLNESGKEVGQMVGHFVLSRQVTTTSPKLSDTALRGLSLEPNADNTRLLFDNASLGLRFLYSRRWHVASVRGPQLTLEEKGGSGILLTIEPLNRLPTGKQFLQESATYLKKQKAQITHMSTVQVLQQSPKMEHFVLDVTISEQKVRMYYFVIQQPAGGVIIAARLTQKDLNNLQREVQQVATSVRVEARKK